MDHVRVGDRTYTFDDIQELIGSSQRTSDEQERMAKHRELSSLNLYAALMQAQALAEIARHLAPVNVRNNVEGSFGFPDELAPEDPQPTAEEQASQLDDIFEARRQFAKTRSKRLTGWLTEMIDQRLNKRKFDLNEKGAFLTIFFEAALGDRPWRYIVTDTAGGEEELNEDHAIRLVDNDAKKSRGTSAPAPSED